MLWLLTDAHVSFYSVEDYSPQVIYSPTCIAYAEMSGHRYLTRSQLTTRLHNMHWWASKKCSSAWMLKEKIQNVNESKIGVALDEDMHDECLKASLQRWQHILLVHFRKISGISSSKQRQWKMPNLSSGVSKQV